MRNWQNAARKIPNEEERQGMCMKKSLINVICLLIPSRAMRKHVRFWLSEYSFSQDKEYVRAFDANVVGDKTVLVVEPSVTHGEIVPGFVQYWLDLGYSVDVLLHRDVMRDNPFCRFKDSRLRFFNHSYTSYKSLLSSPNINKYRYLFFSTAAYARGFNKDGSVYSMRDCMTCLPQRAKSFFLVEHNLKNVRPFKEIHLLEGGRIITLAPFSWEGQRTVMVNPHYFGEVAITPKGKPTQFIVVGALDMQRRNHNLLVDAIFSLVEMGRKDFHITVVGSGRANIAALKAELTGTLAEHVTFTGWITFEELYALMEKSDFLLALMDPDNPAHQRYITQSVSGSYQLSLGFRKPCVMHKAFTSFHNFTEKNSVLYDSGLVSAMQQAMDMENDSYATLQENLGELSRQLCEDSRENLGEAVCNIAKNEKE